MRYYNLNGHLIAKEDAYIHISDVGLQRGYGIFEYFVVVQGVPLFFDDYLDRFEYSAQFMDLQIPLSRAALKKRILDLVTVNKTLGCAIKIILTGGFSEDGYTPASTSNLFIMPMPAIKHPAKETEQGIRLITVDYVRDLPEVKSLNYVKSLIAQKEMRNKGAQDILYHKDGRVSESSRSNFFIVKDDNTVVTTAKDILWGVTRKQIMELAKTTFQLEVRDITISEVLSAKEAFLTSSSKGALAVVNIDGQPIGNGQPGVITKALDELYNQHLEYYVAAALAMV
jgi:branched-subunit amino acid aminotransferase/4-amino-4-deoxychorismate lyase